MKTLLPIRLFLFLLTSLFAINVLGQAPADPGNDPLQSADSLAQTTNWKPAVLKQASVNSAATGILSHQLEKTLAFVAFYNRNENQKQPY